MQIARQAPWFRELHVERKVLEMRSGWETFCGGFAAFLSTESGQESLGWNWQQGQWLIADSPNSGRPLQVVLVGDQSVGKTALVVCRSQKTSVRPSLFAWVLQTIILLKGNPKDQNRKTVQTPLF